MREQRSRHYSSVISPTNGKRGAPISCRGKVAQVGKAKFTKEIVNQRLSDRGITLFGEYSGANTNTTFQCGCGHKWSARPANVLRKSGCPACAGRPKITVEIVNDRLRSRGIKLAGEYTNSSTKTTWQCDQGHQWQDTPTHVMSTKRGCPECTGRRTALSKELINKRLAARGIKMVSEFRHSHKKSLFRCSSNHQWEADPAQVLNTSGCPYCSGVAPLTEEVVNERVAPLGIRLVSGFKNATTKAIFECADGHQWKTSPNDVAGCPYCSNRALLTKAEVNERLADRGIRVVGNYKNGSSKAQVEADCGHTWKTKVSYLLQGVGCPSCASSGFDPTLPAEFYYARINRPRAAPLYMIGITNRSFEKRYYVIEREK